MQRPRNEMVNQDNLPSPRQLKRLASSMILFAQRHNRLKIKQQPEYLQKRYMSPPSIRFERPDILSGSRFGTMFQYSLSSIATRQLGDEWSMRLFRRFEAYNTLEQSPGGVRETFSFAWNTHETTLSRRQMEYVPQAETGDMVDAIDRFSFRDTDVTLIDIEDEISHVTAQDLDVLTADIARIQQKVDLGVKQYSETRPNYWSNNDA